MENRMEASIEIRPEEECDFHAIRGILDAAFGGPVEARLVELLRQRGKAVVALVARLEGQVVGHVLFSPVSVEVAPASFRGVGLAPLAVTPEFQNQGIGIRLTQAGLAACRELGYEAAVVLGHPDYYPRFGFERASLYGLSNEYGEDEAFMAMELRPRGLEGVRGLVKFASEFNEVGC